MELQNSLAQTVVLIVVLGVIGWGAGLAAALAWKAFRGAEPAGLRVRVGAIVVALLVATSCSYAYVVVLASVGVVDQCGVARPVPVAC
jgi:hypothetical protein